MTRMVAVALVTLLGAGCLGGASPTSDGPSPRVGVGVLPRGTGEDSSLLLDAGTLEYRDELLVYRITPTRKAEAWVRVDGFLSEFSSRDDCAVAFAFTPMPANYDEQLRQPLSEAVAQRQRAAGHVATSANRDLGSLHLRTDALSQRVEYGLYPSPYLGGATLSTVANWSVAPGDEVLVFIGGTNPDYARYQFTARPPGSGSVQNHLTMEVNVTGPATIEALPRVPLRCGTGFDRFTGGRHVGTTQTTLTVGGALLMEPRNATTLIFRGVDFALADDGRGVAHYAGLSSPLTPTTKLEVSAPRVGKLGFEIEQWARASPYRLRWFLADAWLPGLSIISEP